MDRHTTTGILITAYFLAAKLLNVTRLRKKYVDLRYTRMKSRLKSVHLKSEAALQTGKVASEQATYADKDRV